jgi:CheY-like chemotaxis protein
MEKIELHEFRQRYDPYLAAEVLDNLLSKGVSLTFVYHDQEFFSKVIHAELDEKSPYIVLDSLMPEAGNELADRKTELAVSTPYLHNGTVYHVRFRIILWGRGKHKDMPVVFATPPLDLKIATEHFTAKPTQTMPLWVQIPLFKEELRLWVSRISIQGLAFEDRLVYDSLPALARINRIEVDFEDESPLIYHGSFRGKNQPVIEFLFEDNPKNDIGRLAAYLESLYSTQSQTRTSDATEAGDKLKRVQIQATRVLILSADAQYVSSLKKSSAEHDIEFSSTAGLESFYAALKQPVDAVLIDNAFPGLDLWAVSRDMKSHMQDRDKLPPIALVSEDLSEDAVVYAQYCGISSVLGRSHLAESIKSNLGTLLGRKEWVEAPEGKPILLIDDDRNVVFTMEHVLKQQGFAPLIASTGTEGVRLAKEHKPIAIILEIAVRSGDGINACRMLKKMPFTKQIPLIVLTASKDPNDLQIVSQIGVEAYLRKPADNAAILKRIQDLVSPGNS